MARARCLLVPLALALALASCSTQAPAGTAPTSAVPAAAATSHAAAPGEQATAPPSVAEGQGTAVAPTPRPASAASPALALALELPWQPLYAGDPLRLLVRLSSPRAHEALYAQYLAAEAEQPTPAGFPVPAIPADWAQGVTLALYRLEPGGTRTPVIPPGDWAAHRPPPEESINPALALNLVWAQEWLVLAEAAQLQEGEYVLAASWSGQGVDSGLLGPDGTVQAEELRFAVKAPADDGEKAVQAGRLAYCAYDKGDYAGARTRGQQALDTGIDDGSPERVDLYFLVAGACLGLEDYDGAIATCQRLITLQPKGSELTLLAQQWIDMIRELQAGPATGSTPTAAGSGFAGTWDASGWGAMTLAVTGNRVTGSYEVNDGKVEGTLSPDGRTLEGTWSNWPTYEPPYDAGRLVLVLSYDGNSLKCRWWFGKDQESVEWLCTRTGR